MTKKAKQSTGRYVYGSGGKYLGTLLKNGRVAKVYGSRKPKRGRKKGTPNQRTIALTRGIRTR
jgi:hypothetical protein